MNLSISTTRREILFGWSYLLISQLVLPNLLVPVGHWLGFSLTEFNILYFCVNFVFVVAIFRRFLWKSLLAAWAKRWRCLLYAAEGFLIYYALLILISLVITPWISPGFSNVNDAVINDLAKEHTVFFGICVVFLGPVAEEMLFRGVVFQGLYRKNRILAYCVSVLLFSAVHIFDYIGSANWKTLLVCFMQYLPAGIAFAKIYETSDTIAIPMLLHIILNMKSFSALR